MGATLVVNPNEFQGYPIELLRSLKGMGPAIIGDDALYAAQKAYNDASSADVAGTVLGPALLTADCTIPVQSISTRTVPDSVKAPARVTLEVDADVESSWDAHDLESLDALCKKHNVTIQGRVKTPAKLIAALEAAGVTP